MLDSEICQITQRLLSRKKLAKSPEYGWHFSSRCSSREASIFWNRVNIVHGKNGTTTTDIFFTKYPEYLTPTKLMRLLNEF